MDACMPTSRLTMPISIFISVFLCRFNISLFSKFKLFLAATLIYIPFFIQLKNKLLFFHQPELLHSSTSSRFIHRLFVRAHTHKHWWFCKALTENGMISLQFSMLIWRCRHRLSLTSRAIDEEKNSFFFLYKCMHEAKRKCALPEMASTHQHQHLQHQNEQNFLFFHHFHTMHW